MSDRDPKLQALFAAADEDLGAPDFIGDVMQRIAGHQRLIMWRRGALALIFALVLWGLSLEALPFTFTQSFIDLGRFGLSDHLIAEALSPVNSVGGVLTLVLLGLRALYRRLFA